MPCGVIGNTSDFGSEVPSSNLAGQLNLINMKNTVTLPLDRYHHLVNCEKITESLQNEEMIFIRRDYHGSWDILNATEGVKKCSKIIKSQESEIEILKNKDSKTVGLLKKKLEIYNDISNLVNDFTDFDKFDYMELFETLKNKIAIHNKLPWYKRIFKKI